MPETTENDSEASKKGSPLDLRYPDCTKILICNLRFYVVFSIISEFHIFLSNQITLITNICCFSLASNCCTSGIMEDSSKLPSADVDNGDQRSPLCLKYRSPRKVVNPYTIKKYSVPSSATMPANSSIRDTSVQPSKKPRLDHNEIVTVATATGGGFDKVAPFMISNEQRSVPSEDSIMLQDSNTDGFLNQFVEFRSMSPSDMSSLTRTMEATTFPANDVSASSTTSSKHNIVTPPSDRKRKDFDFAARSFEKVMISASTNDSPNVESEREMELATNIDSTSAEKEQVSCDVCFQSTNAISTRRSRRLANNDRILKPVADELCLPSRHDFKCQTSSTLCSNSVESEVNCTDIIPTRKKDHYLSLKCPPQSLIGELKQWDGIEFSWIPDSFVAYNEEMGCVYYGGFRLKNSFQRSTNASNKNCEYFMGDFIAIKNGYLESRKAQIVACYQATNETSYMMEVENGGKENVQERGELLSWNFRIVIL